MEERRFAKNRNKNKYSQLNKEINKKIAQTKEKWVQERCDDVEQLQA